MYEVIITSHAERELRRLDRPTKNRILPAVLALADNPRPHGCLKVKPKKGCGGFVWATGGLATKSMTVPKW